MGYGKLQSPGNSLLPSYKSKGLKSNPPAPPAALQLLPWLYSTAMEEFLCSAAISPHISFPSPSLHPSPSQLHTTPSWGRRAGGSQEHQTPVISAW